MAVVQVNVPINGSIEARRNWEFNVSAITDAGDDVEFIDENGNPCNIPFLLLTAETSGSVVRKTVTMETPQSVMLAYGGPIQLWTHKIFGTSDNGLGIIARLV